MWLGRGSEKELVGRENKERQRNGEKESLFFHYLRDRVQSTWMKRMTAQ
jgi:hypothetical protein